MRSLALYVALGVLAGCVPRLSGPLAYRDAHRARLEPRAEDDLDCRSLHLMALGPRVVQVLGCAQARQYAWSPEDREHGPWVAIASVPSLAPIALGCPAELVSYRSAGPQIRIAEGCGARLRYDLRCEPSACAWVPTARAVSRIGVQAHDLWPREPERLELAVLEPRLRRGKDEGLLGAGVGLALAGLLGGFVVGIDDALSPRCSGLGPSEPTVSCGAGGLSLIPIVGGLLAGTVEIDRPRRSGAGSVLAGIGLGAAQIAGLIITIVAVHGSTEDLVSAWDLEGGGELALVPWGDPWGAGIAIAGRL